jgi:hypothetical protein
MSQSNTENKSVVRGVCKTEGCEYGVLGSAKGLCDLCEDYSSCVGIFNNSKMGQEFWDNRFYFLMEEIREIGEVDFTARSRIIYSIREELKDEYKKVLLEKVLEGKKLLELDRALSFFEKKEVLELDRTLKILEKELEVKKKKREEKEEGRRKWALEQYRKQRIMELELKHNAIVKNEKELEIPLWHMIEHSFYDQEIVDKYPDIYKYSPTPLCSRCFKEPCEYIGGQCQEICLTCMAELEDTDDEEVEEPTV